MSAIALTQSEYSTIKDSVVFFDFWAEWCAPCREMEPVLDSEVIPNFPEIAFYKVNIDEEPEIAKKYSIRSIPTMLVVKFDSEGNHTILETFIGLQNDIKSMKGKIAAAVEKANS